MSSCALTPAYGRDYKSKSKIMADLKAGKDFILHDEFSRWNGKYINMPQLIEAGYTYVKVRNADLTKSWDISEALSSLQSGGADC